MHRIQIFNSIAEKGLGNFPDEAYEVGNSIADPDAILLRSHKLDPAAVRDRLRAVARAGAGTNNVPVADCTEAGVVVFNTPGANANAVKELVLCGLLLASRGILQGIRFAEENSGLADFAEYSRLIERGKKQFKGSEIAGKTLGVIGLGAIGSLVAEMGIKLNMNVQGYDPALSVEAAWRLPSQVTRMESLQALFASSDFISLHLPMLDTTRGLINGEQLATTKPGACLLNFAREEIVDATALRKALDTGRLAKYVSDFPRPDLLGRKDVIFMPHLGASTREAEENCAVMAVNQIRDFLENGNIRNSVNFPDLFLDRVPNSAPGARLAIANLNVPRMLGQITSILADQNINVIDMLNKSRGDVAYNLIDLERPASASALNAMRNIEHVIKVTAI